MAETMKRIVVVGSINTDLVVTTERLPQRGETLTGGSFATFQGGKGANQAVAAAMLGASVVMVGKVGSDGFGAESVRALEERGVDCEHVERAPGESGTAVITVGAGGENTIIVVPGANALVSPEFVEAKRAVIRGAAVVLAQLEIPLESVVALGRICKEEGVPLMLDPAPAKVLPPELMGLCEWFTPNETEAMFYLGEGDEQGEPKATAAALRAMGARSVLLKMGERGAYIDRPGAEPVSVAAVTVKAVDTTAAGDTFNGAFAAAMSRGEGMEACGRFAAAAAALSVTRAGAQASMPALAEVRAMLEAEV